MSLPLKPLSVDYGNKKVDSKQKKFIANVTRTLETFDSVTEWADYISSLGKLLKALQSWTPNSDDIKYYVPSPYQVSQRLASSLSPELPAGVHQKTLEVYTYIFEKIGQESLATECNIWIRGILPLMAYATMSVKLPLIELYEKYLINLPSSTLKLIVKPLIASLLPGIDDESSEFQPSVLNLLDEFKTRLNDDSIFWQSFFLVMISNKEHRLGGLVLLTKTFPSLNIDISIDQIPDQSGISELDDFQKRKQHILGMLPKEIKDIVTPEPGLLGRAFLSCLTHDNDLLVKRGILDLLVNKFYLHSPIFQYVLTPNDRKMLIIECCKTTSNKEMSLNRRIWNWLLGPTVTTGSSNIEHLHIQTDSGDTSFSAENDRSAYFTKYALTDLLSGLTEMLKTENDLVMAMNICLTIMDRWEIGSIVIPEVFINVFMASKGYSDSNQIAKISSSLFDAIETDIIWGKIFEYFYESKDVNFLLYILTTFNVSQDEEIIVRHLPLILLGLLSFTDDTFPEESDLIHKYHVSKQLLDIIPERAFLPFDESILGLTSSYNAEGILTTILKYYRQVSDPLESEMLNDNNGSVPFTADILAYLIVKSSMEILLRNLEIDNFVNESSLIFISIFEKLPEISGSDSSFNKIFPKENLMESIITAARSEYIKCDSINGIITVYNRYLWSKLNAIDLAKVLKVIVSAMWKYLVTPHEQDGVVKYLEVLERDISPSLIESALTSVFIHEPLISNKITVLDLLWNNLKVSSTLIDRMLELVLDELFDSQSPHYLYVSEWILSVTNSGSLNRLLHVLLTNITEFGFLRSQKLTDLDDLDMFTYRLKLLNVTISSNQSIIGKKISKEMVDMDIVEKWPESGVTNYKDLIISIIIRFLEVENNHHVKSIRSSLLLLDGLLDGTEKNFKNVVLSLLNLSSKYLKENEINSKSIAVSLLNIVSKVLQLSHENGIKLDIFDDNATHLKYIDYLVSSVSSMEDPMIISSYIKLLLESVLYIEQSIFKCILPLTNSIVQCLQKIFRKEKVTGGFYQSISLLLGGFQELLELTHGYLLADEKNGMFSTSNSRGDFLQSMVSNVFSGDNQEYTSRIQAERLVVFQSFQLVINCTSEIWYWAHKSILQDGEKSKIRMKSHSLYKFKFRCKMLLERLFLLEPLEVLENLIAIKNDELTILLVHSLDGNRPILTVPYLLFGLVTRCNKNSMIKLSTGSGVIGTGNSKPLKIDQSLINRLNSHTIILFLIQYVESLESDSIEEFFPDFISFFKEVSSNSSFYADISTNILKFIALSAEKIDNSKFGKQKNVRKELSDLFMKYQVTLFTDLPKNEDDALLKVKMDDIITTVERLTFCVNDEVGSDKFNSFISNVVNVCISSHLKSIGTKPIPEKIFELSILISKNSEKVKNWKLLINDIFFNDKRFSLFNNDESWKNIIYEWSQYQENKIKLIPELLSIIDAKGMTITPSLINFSSWSSSEINAKSKNFLRIAYLLMVAPIDTYLLNFKVLMTSVIQYLSSKSLELRSTTWLLLRVMLIRFSHLHFNEHWSAIVFYLQTGLQEFYEIMQIQENINGTLVFQLCKTLDLLLVLNIEEFSTTNEWLFVIDTINCIYRDSSFIALADEIGESNDYKLAKNDEIALAEQSDYIVPLLNGTQSINSHLQLRTFFQKVSYMHYEAVYSLKELDIPKCEDDLIKDIFV
ncbi:hypothetical protein Kpol_543p58 [Vanderwaltozyma polyspora DSM 70294]|uniref:Uncharacterized protein n=1 Tax=Vanderwaltozyma polyspora (strain ATCC 22028 / DSM 70294 / BCRC 21397 / CBS 2163 / NBRC 10782 / NRRL Y-8283 / UCD 57-17) TaxID=436907 RepID=A7THR2_VANPO|nr:uncharacterized protein Kpol_543p58 [Vanderwaltozyma polyspora DSM 70294]EDO18228.1 hypothetical protein Kpol_543p58 [Vanderwaltozyma polyspora DSM 70294]